MAIGYYGWRTPSQGGVLPFIGSPEMGFTETAQQTLYPGTSFNSQGGSQLAQTIAGQNTSQNYSAMPPANYSTSNYSQNTTTNTAPTNTNPQYQIGGWYDGKQWDGSRFGNPGEIIVNSNNNTTSTTSQPSVESQLDSQYTALFGDLDRQLSELDTQRDTQEGRVKEEYGDALSELKSERDWASSQIDKQQTKSLQDVGTSLQNLWNQGSRILGSRGASDSSAAGMFNYAVQKLGSKQRGDLMWQYNSRRENLERVYSNNLTGLEKNKLNQINAISDWYTSSLSNLKTQKTSLAAQKSQQLYEYAKGQLDEVKAEARSRKDALDTWILNHSTKLSDALKVLGYNAENLPFYSGPLNAGAKYAGTKNPPGMFGYSNSDYMENML